MGPLLRLLRGYDVNENDTYKQKTYDAGLSYKFDTNFGVALDYERITGDFDPTETFLNYKNDQVLLKIGYKW